MAGRKGITGNSTLITTGCVRLLGSGKGELFFEAHVRVECAMASRYGTGELYGFDFSTLPAERIRELSQTSHKIMVCPFKRVQPGKPAPKCNKKGGVCSLRLFVEDESGKAEGKGEPVTTCPNRFLEGSVVAQWMGETLLGTSKPLVISELPFLMGEIQAEEEADQDAVCV